MRQSLIKIIGAATCAAVLGSSGFAQDGKARLNESDEIIIMKKDDKDVKDVKVTVEIKDGEVRVNGKPLEEYNNDDLVVIKRKNDRSSRVIAPRTPASPFRGSSWNFNEEDQLRNLQLTDKLHGLIDPNKAFLGVTTNKTNSGGVEVTSVTKNSAAEKSGLKEGDVITKVNGTVIESPDDLSRTIGKFKPEEKVDVAYRRDKKEVKTTVTLGKRANTGTARTFNLNNDFNFDLTSPDGSNLFMWGNGLKLGIKAQDTEDGKGVMVLNIDDSSKAEKAGIRKGDIINEFDGKTVNSAMELANAAKNAKDKSSIKVKLSREGKPQELDIKVPRNLKTANL